MKKKLGDDNSTIKKIAARAIQIQNIVGILPPREKRACSAPSAIGHLFILSKDRDIQRLRSRESFRDSLRDSPEDNLKEESANGAGQSTKREFRT
jgi:hypothetical protein